MDCCNPEPQPVKMHSATITPVMSTTNVHLRQGKVSILACSTPGFAKARSPCEDATPSTMREAPKVQARVRAE